MEVSQLVNKMSSQHVKGERGKGDVKDDFLRNCLTCYTR